MNYVYLQNIWPIVAKTITSAYITPSQTINQVVYTLKRYYEFPAIQMFLILARIETSQYRIYSNLLLISSDYERHYCNFILSQYTTYHPTHHWASSSWYTSTNINPINISSALIEQDLISGNNISASNTLSCLRQNYLFHCVVNTNWQ